MATAISQIYTTSVDSTLFTASIRQSGGGTAYCDLAKMVV